MKNQKKVQAVVQEFVNELPILWEKRNDLFKDAQDESEKLTSVRGCSFEMNVERIQSAGRDSLARKMAVEYAKINAQIDLIEEFSGNLAEAGFWKQ